MERLRAEAHDLAEGVKALNYSVQHLTRRTKRSERFIIGLGASLALSLLMLVALVGLGWKVRSVTGCQAEQNTRFQAAVTAGRDAATLDRQGQKALLDTILNPLATQEQRRAAVETYRTYLGQAETVRDSKPIPPPADCR